MTHEQIVTAATDAVKGARAKYGKGWDFVSDDQKIGTAVQIVVTNFASYSPSSPAHTVAEVVQIAVGIVTEGEI